MAEWWDTTRNKFESGTASSSSSSTTTSSELMGSFAWPTDMTDIKPRSCSSFDSELVTGASGIFQDTQKLQGPNTDPNLHMMGLGLSSHSQDWNQTLLREEKAETGFLSIIPENANFQQDHAGMVQWREKLFGDDSTDSSVHEVKQMNRGFSLDQSQFVSHCSSSDTTSSASFHVDHSSYGSLSAMSCQGLLGYENQSQQQQQPSFDNKSTMNFPYPLANYTMNPSEILPSHWSTRPIPQFLRNSPPKQQSQFHFSTTPFWNPTSASMNNVRPSFFPPLPGHFSAQTFEEKPKNILDIRDSISVGKKSGSNQPAASKRPRNETQSPLPALKVRKEKMGDRITALQQLVSPFGKTDTASVLSEAIEYIKFLHEQVGVLSTPYLKSGAPIQPQQNHVNSKDQDGPKQDLRSRGLCLVPVSSTFPVTHETTVNFWTPSFGGSYR